jgi:L,D-transpeptidase YcbB
MKRTALLLLILLPILLPTGGPAVLGAAADPTLIPRVAAVLRARLPPSGAAPRLTLDGEPVPASPDLSCFYERRGAVPAWSDASGLRAEAVELLQALAAAAAEGLRPEDYRAAGLAEAARSAADPEPPPDALADLDLLLTNAFVTYSSHLRRGRVDPREVHRDCAVERPGGDPAQVLEEALATGRVREALAEQAPPHAGYALLRGALAELRAAAPDRNGWPAVPAGKTLRLGDRDARVEALRRRLAATGEAPAAPAQDAERFDDGLAEAVRAFQRRHGLEPDAAVGPKTLAALNASAPARARQVELNLERWRWLPRDLGERHVLVNIAGFELRWEEPGREPLLMKVIVGRPYTRSPMFTSAMNQVVLNPWWNVPASITRNEILPRLRRDPGYLARENMIMTSTRDGGVSIRQRPGPGNALGRIKFLFPNRFGVYLHDTPSRSLFERTVRTFSHGCIRIEKPLELAEAVLRDDPAWTPQAIRAALDRGATRTIPLARPVPVHVVYWTAWMDGEGVLQLRDDVYDRDSALAEALEEVQPGPDQR